MDFAAYIAPSTVHSVLEYALMKCVFNTLL